MTKRTGDSHSPKGRKTASHHEHHEHQAAIIDPPNHVAIPPPEIHHPALQRHAALKANALMSSVMAQARGAAASDTGPRQAQQPLVLQPTVLHAAPIGPADQEGIGLHVLAAGVIVQMYPWVPMAVGDLLELFWGTYPGGTVTASKLIAFPDEVNRPVLLPIPAGVIDAGWVNITCRVTHANTGFQNASPPRPLLVKLNPPGGIAPPPEVNHNLPPPILPPEIIDQGVDANQAARGVPVTIEPYPNMDDGDRIRLNWGGAYVVHTVTREQVNRPITIIVDDATIRSVGDGHALNVRYQVFDRVNNRSGWSPSAKVWVHVVPGALLPPQVTNADSDYRIHLSQLGNEDVRVLVTAYIPNFKVGDKIDLQWFGHTAQGVQVPFSDYRIFNHAPMETLEYFVPNAYVKALAGGDATVCYTLPNGWSSQQVHVDIVGDVDTLPAPTVDEASGGQLDASLDSATVRIPANPAFAPGDLLTLMWSGVRADGTPLLYQITRPITGGMVGRDILLLIPGSEIAPLAGGTLDVSYTLLHGDGTLLPASGVLRLRVGSGAGLLLQEPTVDEAPDNLNLDPANVRAYATVRIEPYDPMDVGDRVEMFWVGSSGPGGTFSDWIDVSAIMLGRPILFYVDKLPFVTANDGGTVTISYTVTKGGTVEQSMALTLNIGAALDVIPAITTVTDSRGEVPNGSRTTDRSVTLTGTARGGMAVELYDGATLLGAVRANDDGDWTYVANDLALGDHSFTARGLYGNQPVSEARTLTVAQEPIVEFAPAITAIWDDAGNRLYYAERTRSTTLTFEGTGVHDKSLNLWDHWSTSYIKATFNVRSDGTWNIRVTGLPLGNHTFNAVNNFGSGIASNPMVLQIVA